jgi:hypothetical protein
MLDICCGVDNMAFVAISMPAEKKTSFVDFFTIIFLLNSQNKPRRYDIRIMGNLGA